MLVKYTWFEDPENPRILDTTKTLRGCAGLLHSLGSYPTMEEWNKIELANLERYSEKGLILHYEIMEGGPNT